MLPDFGKYDVPVGGNLIPAPSFQANGVESVFVAERARSKSA